MARRTFYRGISTICFMAVYTLGVKCIRFILKIHGFFLSGNFIWIMAVTAGFKRGFVFWGFVAIRAYIGRSGVFGMMAFTRFMAIQADIGNGLG